MIDHWWGDGVFWFRILGYGLHIRHMRGRDTYELYGDRLRKWWRIGPYRVKVLTP